MIVDRNIYSLQRYVRDIMNLSITVNSDIYLPVYIFDDIFDKYHSDIWFEIGRASYGGYNNYILTLIQHNDNNQYLLQCKSVNSNNIIDLDMNISDVIHKYFTSIKREKKLKKLLKNI